MILANVSFGTARGQAVEQLEDAAEGYLASLFHSGQLCGEYFHAWTKGQFNAYVMLSGPAAYEWKFHSARGKRELRKVATFFGRQPRWKLLDDDTTKRQVSWKRAPSLYLFTHAFNWASPVCRGDTGEPVPMHTLPISFVQKEDLYRWQRSYCEHDRIWLGSGALEIAAYRQLVEPESDLSRSGRDLSRDIEAATGVPTFYYLMRYWGRRKGDEERRCPGCGATWRVSGEIVKPARFFEFGFRCKSCRLVSNLADCPDGCRHARIGEFRARKS